LWGSLAPFESGEPPLRSSQATKKLRRYMILNFNLFNLCYLQYIQVSKVYTMCVLSSATLSRERVCTVEYFYVALRRAVGFDVLYRRSRHSMRGKVVVYRLDFQRFKAGGVPGGVYERSGLLV